MSRGEENDLLERLASDPGFKNVPAAAFAGRAWIRRCYTGPRTAQVGEFIEEYLQPLLARARPLAVETETAEIGV